MKCEYCNKMIQPSSWIYVIPKFQDFQITEFGPELPQMKITTLKFCSCDCMEWYIHFDDE